jgi:hypothetical protein
MALPISMEVFFSFSRASEIFSAFSETIASFTAEMSPLT